MQPRKETAIDDEELAELPPLDGDGEGEDSPAPAPDFDDDEVAGDAGSPLDDSTGEDDPVPLLDIAETAGGWIDDEEHGLDLDLGGDEILSEQADLLSDNEEPGVGDEDYGLSDAAETTDRDAGEEGPGDDDEELREEDLPRLDADEDGAPDDHDFIDEGFASDEGLEGIGWGSPRWEPVRAPFEIGAMRAVAGVARGALAGGSRLFALDLEGGSESLPAAGLDGGDVTQLYAAGPALVVTTEEGGLFTSRDGGASFVAVTSWRAHVRPDEAAAGIEVALGGAELWARTAQGALLASTDLGQTWRPVDAGGFVAAVAVDERGGLLAVVHALRGSELVRGSRATLAHVALPERVAPASATGRLRLRARGAAVAILVEGRGVELSLDGGVSWTRAAGTERATALAWPNDDAGLLVGLHDDRRDRTWLTRVSARGEASLLAEVTCAQPELEGGVLDLAWDDARGVVWAAGGFGVLALQSKGIR